MRRAKQQTFDFRRWGGKRAGAGRKRGIGTMHRRRPKLDGRKPLHVTLRVRADAPRLRNDTAFNEIREALRHGHERPGFRLCHFTVEGNHLHFIVEADDKRALSRGMQGLCIRMARLINRAFGRKGKLFAHG